MKFGPGHFTFNWRLTLTLTFGQKFLQRRSWKGFDFRLRKKEKSWDKILRRWGKQARFRYTGSLSWCGTPSYTTLVGWGQEPVRKSTELNGHILMYIYHKQCGIMQKIQWKGAYGQLQCFYNGMSVFGQTRPTRMYDPETFDQSDDKSSPTTWHGPGHHHTALF